MTMNEEIDKAIKHFKSVRDDAKVVLDSGFGTHEGENDIFYRNRVKYAEMAIEALEREKWIPCSERMPEVHDTIFAKFYGTPKWNKYMTRKASDYVIVTVEYENGERATQSMHTSDGKWRDDFAILKKNIISWKSFPKPDTESVKK